MKFKDYPVLTEEEMLESLDVIWQNFSYSGDRKIYSKMLVLLDNMRYFLHTDLQIDYPKEYYDELDKCLAKEGVFEF